MQSHHVITFCCMLNKACVYIGKEIQSWALSSHFFAFVLTRRAFLQTTSLPWWRQWSQIGYSIYLSMGKWVYDLPTFISRSSAEGLDCIDCLLSVWPFSSTSMYLQPKSLAMITAGISRLASVTSVLSDLGLAFTATMPSLGTLVALEMKSPRGSFPWIWWNPLLSLVDFHKVYPFHAWLWFTPCTSKLSFP